MRRKIIILLITALFLNVALCFANESKESEESDKKKVKEDSFLKSLVKDQGHILSSPARMKGNDFLKWGAVALVTGVLIKNDEKIYREFKKFQANHSWVDDISPKITKLGLGEYNIGIAGGFFLGGLIFKSPKAKETSKLILMTYIHTGIIAQIGKHMFSRQRPSWENGKDHWYGPSGAFKRYDSGQLAHYDAFPSGHMISIMGTATVVAHMYSDTPLVPVISYTVAGLCGLSRVTEDTHWLSDVVISTALGYAVGRYIYKKRNRYNKNRLDVMPVVGMGRMGVGLRYTF